MVRFAKYGRYRHQNCLDIDFVIMQIQYMDSKRIILKGLWTLQDNPDFVVTADKITIKSEDYCRWRCVV